MSNELFYASARTTAGTVTSPPDYSALMYTTNPVVLQNILNDLAVFATSFWQNQVDRAAESGLKFTTIFRYFRTDMFQGFPTDLLINGPLNDPNFFSNYGYNSVMNQINVSLAPGRAVNYYSGQNKGSRIMLFW